MIKLIKRPTALFLAVICSKLAEAQPNDLPRSASEEHLGRNLAALWTNKSNSSKKCKEECIDKGFFYCADDLIGRGGVCCTTPYDCTRTQDSVCSSDTTSGGLAYATCPRDTSLCGTEVIQVEARGETRLKLHPLVADKFTIGRICRYQLEFPFEAGIYDQIIVTAKKLDNAMAYLVETEELKKDAEYEQRVLIGMGDKASASAPNKVYLVVVARDSSRKAQFDFLLTFKDLDGEAIALEKQRLAEELQKLEELEQAQIKQVENEKEEAAERERQKIIEMAEKDDQPISIEGVVTIQKRNSFDQGKTLSDEDKIALACVIVVVIIALISAMIFLRRRVIQKEVMKMHPIVTQELVDEGSDGARVVQGRVIPIVATEALSIAPTAHHSVERRNSLAHKNSVDRRNSCVRRNSLFEVDSKGFQVRIRAALMTMDNSVKSRHEMLEASERLSQVMSLYKGKAKSMQQPGDGVDQEASQDQDIYQLGSIQQSPRHNASTVELQNTRFASQTMLINSNRLELPSIRKSRGLGSSMVTAGLNKSRDIQQQLNIFKTGSRHDQDQSSGDYDLQKLNSPASLRMFSVKHFDINAVEKVPGSSNPDQANNDYIDMVENDHVEDDDYKLKSINHPVGNSQQRIKMGPQKCMSRTIDSRVHQKSASAAISQSFQATRQMIGAALEEFKIDQDDANIYLSSNLGSLGIIVQKKKKKKKRKVRGSLSNSIAKTFDGDQPEASRPGTTNIFHRLKAMTDYCIEEEEKVATATSPNSVGASLKKQKVMLGQNTSLGGLI